MGVHMFDALRWFTDSEVDADLRPASATSAGWSISAGARWPRWSCAAASSPSCWSAWRCRNPASARRASGPSIGSDGIIESDSYGKVRLGRGDGWERGLRDAVVRAQRRRLQPRAARGIRRAGRRASRRRSRPAAGPASPARMGAPRSRSSRRRPARRPAARPCACRSAPSDRLTCRRTAADRRIARTLNPAEPGTSRAAATFPTFTVLADGSLLATYSIGSTKDSDDLTVELRRSHDGGATWGPPRTPFETHGHGPARIAQVRTRSRGSMATA